MATREELIAQIQQEEEAQAIQAELAKRKTGLGDRVMDAGMSLAKAGKTVWDNLARGAGNAVAGMTSQSLERDAPELFPKKSPLGRFSEGVARDVQESLPVPENESTPGMLLRKGTEAVGGGLVMGGPGLMKAPVAGLATLFAGGVGGDIGETTGRNLGGKEGPLADKLGTLGSVLGSTAAALPMGLMTGPSQTSGQAAIRRNSQGLSPLDFQKAEENLALFKRTGAKTATLPEAFEGRTSLLGLAENTRASKGGEDLANRTASRADDLSQLGKTFLNNIGPKVEGNVVAERVAQAANALEQNLNKLKNQAFGNRLEGTSVRPDLVKQLEDALLAEANREVRGGPKGAYREIAASLRNPDTGALITSTPELSKVLYGFQTQMKNGAVMGKAGNAIASNDMAIPLQNAKEGLETFSPPFAAANTEARAFNQGPRTEFAQSPLKKLADRNPNIIDPTPIGRLNAITDGTSEQQIAKLLATLERDPGLAPGQGVGANEITRAIMQNKLKGAPTNPGKVVRQNPGSDLEAQLAQMLRSGGKDPQKAMEPLLAADKLQNFSGLPGMKEPPDLNASSALIRPHRTADFLLTDASREKMHREIASLMAPTPENLRKLQEIAKFDPNVRRMLIARGIIAPQFAKE